MLQIILINYGFLYITERTYRLKNTKKHDDDDGRAMFYETIPSQQFK